MRVHHDFCQLVILVAFGSLGAAEKPLAKISDGLAGGREHG